ncbi:MAG TPA: hypothetical protein VGE98_14940 [Thermoanaerobaculia bacterium]
MSEALYLTEPQRPLSEAWFAPMGLALRVVTDSAEILAAADTAFGGFGRAEAAAVADATFRLFTHEVDDDVAAPPLLRADGPLVYQTAGRGSTLVLDRRCGTAFGYFSPAALANPVYFRWHFLDLALFFLLEERGFLGIHGAALARGGRGLLLRAASGSGKSTLAYAAARRRFQAVADDIVWFAPDGGRLWGLPWTFHLLPDTAARFPELAGQACTRQLNGEDKIAVPLEALRPGSTAASAEPAAIVLLRRGAGDGSVLTPLSAANAWDEWLAGAASREPAAPDYARRARALLDRLPLYRLEVGEDLEAGLDLLEPLLPGGPP